MLRSRTRTLAASGALLLALSLLTSCGDDAVPAAQGGDGTLSDVKITGKAGEAPEVDITKQLGTDQVESEVITEGDGATIEDGDSVLTQLWIANGYTKQKVFSTWEGGAPEVLTAGGDLSAPLKEAVDGHAIGSRVAVLATAKDSFGEAGNAQLGIGNKDSVLWVVDLIGTVSDGPQGETRSPAKWAPTLIEKDGHITGFDWESTNHRPQVNGPLLDTTLIKGDGPKVESGQTIYARYLGQVFGGKEPFDQNYFDAETNSVGEPRSFPVGIGQVISGWDKELVGKTVGSRVILEIPPAEGYGKEGKSDAGIKGTDTLVFVVDILGAH